MFELISRFAEICLKYGTDEHKEIMEFHCNNNTHMSVIVNGVEKHAYSEVVDLHEWWLANHEEPYSKEATKFFREHLVEKKDEIVGWLDGDGPLYSWDMELDSEENEREYRKLRDTEAQMKKEYQDKLNEMLGRIISVRHFLWD
jgi:hypothetical protein